MKTPTAFAQPRVLQQIGYARIAKFLDAFAEDLKAVNPVLLSTLNPELSTGSNYFAEVADFLAATADLPERLRQAMTILETAIHPENVAVLDAAIQRRIPNVAVSQTCPLDRALELWFTAPDEMAAFKVQGSTVQSSTVEAPFSSSPGPVGHPVGHPSIPESTNPSPPASGSSPIGNGQELSTFNLQPSTGPTANHKPLLPSEVLLTKVPKIENDRERPASEPESIENDNDARELFRANSNLNLKQTCPCPESVDGELLLDDLVQALSRYVILAKWVAETVALWILHTYAFKLREVSTYLGIESPAHRCGKTTLLAVLNQLAERTVTSANLSSSSFFRAIEELQPTLLIDEADTFLKGKHELRGILNAGYTKDTGYVMRVVPEPSTRARQRSSRSTSSSDCDSTLNSKPSISRGSRLVRFSCWCPKVIARIGRLPETLADRCILIRMHRKTSQEKCQRLRKLQPASLKAKCARFVLDHAAQIAAAEPSIPEALNDRSADIWEPLFALADLAGGHWPQSARQAALALSESAQDSSPVGSLLLDIFILFSLSGQNRLFTRELLDGLNTRFPSRPWLEALNGKQATEIWLSQQLRPYGIRPRTIWKGDASAKGYAEEDFREAFRRYIPRSEIDALVPSNPTPPEPKPGVPS